MKPPCLCEDASTPNDCSAMAPTSAFICSPGATRQTARDSPNPGPARNRWQGAARFALPRHRFTSRARRTRPTPEGATMPGTAASSAGREED